MKIKYMTLFVLAFAVVACSGDENLPDRSRLVSVQVLGDIDNSSLDAANRKWAADDSIGISALGKSPESIMAPLYKNAKYLVASEDESATFIAAEKHAVFFQDAAEQVVFSAYCPYQKTAAASSRPGTAGVITGITTIDQSKQKSFDYLFATGATSTNSNPVVNFVGKNAFKHMMTQLNFIMNLAEESGFTVEDLENATYRLTGLKHSGTFDITTGKAMATGSATADWGITSVYNGVFGNEHSTCSLILYPQDLSGGFTFIAEIGGQTFSTIINTILVPTTVHTYKVSMSKKGLTISGTIASWGNGVDKEVDAT